MLYSKSFDHSLLLFKKFYLESLLVEVSRILQTVRKTLIFFVSANIYVRNNRLEM